MNSLFFYKDYNYSFTIHYGAYVFYYVLLKDMVSLSYTDKTLRSENYCFCEKISSYFKAETD